MIECRKCKQKMVYSLSEGGVYEEKHFYTCSNLDCEEVLTLTDQRESEWINNEQH